MLKRFCAILGAAMLLSVQMMPVALSEDLAEDPEVELAEEEPEYYLDTFVISAYYSPLEGQNRYVTGSLAGDRRLNGNGTNGADGTPVYPGMIAAPSIYAFGTKMDIPGIGVTTVHDRGGAIVPAGQRGYAHDRLDVWMGAGDEGLTRALQWGKRTVENVKVYGIQPELEDTVYIENYSAAESFVQNTVLSPLTFPEDIYFGSEGENVRKMQEYLQEWGYYKGEISGFYGEDTAQAVFEFQLDFVDAVDDADDLGAGHFGIQTRTQFDKHIHGDVDQASLKLARGRSLMAKYTDLYEPAANFGTSLGLGSSGDAVYAVQEELVKLGFLRIEPTGHFGEVTAHAVGKFQLSRNIVDSKEDAGYGYVGPATRTALNLIVDERYKMKSQLAYQRDAVERGSHIVLRPDTIVAIKED